jgi:hypothetical protein
MRFVPSHATSGKLSGSRRLLRRCGLIAAALLLMAAGPVSAETSAGAHRHTSKTRHSAHQSSRSALPISPTTTLQIATLRYMAWLGLPQQAREELHADASPSNAMTTNDATSRCGDTASGAGSGGTDKVAPCLGLSRDEEALSAVKFRFDVTRKSIGAPKDIFVGRCPVGSDSAACNDIIMSEALAEQERLADTLSGQRRYPFATVGIALSF